MHRAGHEQCIGDTSGLTSIEIVEERDIGGGIGQADEGTRKRSGLHKLFKVLSL